MPSCSGSSTTSSSSRRAVASSSSSPAPSAVRMVECSATGSNTNHIERSHSPTCNDVTDCLTEKTMEVSIGGAAAAFSDDACSAGQVSAHGRGRRSTAVTETTTENSYSSLPPSSPTTVTWPLKACTGGEGETREIDHTPVKEQYAHHGDHLGPPALVPAKKEQLDPFWRSNDSTEGLSRQQLGIPLARCAHSSRGTLNVGCSPHGGESPISTAPPPRSSISRLPTPDNRLGSAQDKPSVSQQRAEKSGRLSPPSSRIGVLASSRPVSPLKLTSPAVTQHPQWPSGWDLVIPKASATAIETGLISTPVAHARASNTASGVMSPFRPHTSVQKPGGSAEARAASGDTIDSFSGATSTPQENHTVTPIRTTTLPFTSLQLAPAPVAHQQMPLSSSRPCNVYVYTPSPVASIGTGNSKKKREEQKRSTAAHRSMCSTGFDVSGSAHDALSGMPKVVPTHDSVFFPAGTEVIAPVLLHYLTLGGWSTMAGGRDYFNHRRLRPGEVVGHTVLWLHTARPRDRFVFLITPVGDHGDAAWTSFTAAEAAETRRLRPSAEVNLTSHRTTRTETTTGRWGWNTPSALLHVLRTRLFGEAPWFTYRDTAAVARTPGTPPKSASQRSSADATAPIGGSLSDLSTYNDSDVEIDGTDSVVDGDPCRYHSSPPLRDPVTPGNVASPANTRGVEAVVVAHADVTAMDYAPRLTSHRLTIEATAACTLFFPLLSDALAFFQCEEAMELIEHQWASGVTSQVPRPRAGGRSYKKQGTPKANHVPASRSSSSVCTMSSTFPGEAPVREDGDLTSRPSSTPQMQLRVGMNPNVCCEAAHHSSSTGADPPSASPDGDRNQCTQLLSLSEALRNAESADIPRHGCSPKPPTVSAASLAAAPEKLYSQTCQHQRVSNLHRSPGNSAVDTPATSDAAAANRILALTSPPRLTSSHGEVVISVYTADPVLNSVLRELLVPEPGTHPYTVNLAAQKKLLSMVEVGMPTWTVLYSSTGLPYRRLFRILYSCLTNLWPLLSLAVGLYDLYKHLPQLKQFMEHTLEPLTRWVEQRFTIRVSVLVTYLISVVVTIFGSLGSFVSQTYIVQLFYLPIVRLVLALLKLPFLIVFDMVWTLATTVFGAVSVVLQVVRIVVMAPLVLVTNVASLRDTLGTALPVAAEGTSLSLKWWRSWMEFWETVASPIKNAARAWWDSMMHVSTSAARREMSIRRWYSPKLEHLALVVEELQECITLNAQMWWSYFILPGIKLKLLLIVGLIYMYWLFMVISPDLWDEVIHASGVRHPSSFTRSQPAASMPTTVTSETQARAPYLPSTAPVDPYPVAHRRGDAIGTCQKENSASASISSYLGLNQNAFPEEAPQAAPRDSSTHSAGAQTSPTVFTEKFASPASSSGTTPTTLQQQSRQTFSALVAELLLPEVVLALLQHIWGALVRGWTVAVAATSHRKAGHANDTQTNRPIVSRAASLQCTWADTLATAYFSAQSAVEDVAAMITDTRRHSNRMKRYVNSTIVHLRWDGDTPFDDPDQLLRIWQTAALSKWGSVVGRGTPLARAAVVLELQNEATEASNTNGEETSS